MKSEYASTEKYQLISMIQFLDERGKESVRENKGVEGYD